MLCYFAQEIRTRMSPYIHILQFSPLELSLVWKCPESSFCSNDVSFPSWSLFWHVTIFLPPLPDSFLFLYLDQNLLCQLKLLLAFSDYSDPNSIIPCVATSLLKFRFRKAAEQCVNEHFDPLSVHVNRGWKNCNDWKSSAILWFSCWPLLLCG